MLLVGMQVGSIIMESNMEVPKKFKIDMTCDLCIHFWIYNQRKWKQDYKDYIYPLFIVAYSQLLRFGNNKSAFQKISGWSRCAIYT